MALLLPTFSRVFPNGNIKSTAMHQSENHIVDSFYQFAQLTICAFLPFGHTANCNYYKEQNGSLGRSPSVNDL